MLRNGEVGDGSRELVCEFDFFSFLFLDGLWRGEMRGLYLPSGRGVGLR